MEDFNRAISLYLNIFISSVKVIYFIPRLKTWLLIHLQSPSMTALASHFKHSNNIVYTSLPQCLHQWQTLASHLDPERWITQAEIDDSCAKVLGTSDVHILILHTKSSGRCQISPKSNLQHENDSKHTATAKYYCQRQEEQGVLQQMVWPLPRTDLNIMSAWDYIKRQKQLRT